MMLKLQCFERFFLHKCWNLFCVILEVFTKNGISYNLGMRVMVAEITLRLEKNIIFHLLWCQCSLSNVGFCNSSSVILYL